MDVDEELGDQRSLASDPSNDRLAGDTGECNPDEDSGLLVVEVSFRCRFDRGVGMCETNSWLLPPGRAEPSAPPKSIGNVTSGDQNGERAGLHPTVGLKCGPDRFRLL